MVCKAYFIHVFDISEAWSVCDLYPSYLTRYDYDHCYDIHRFSL